MEKTEIEVKYGEIKENLLYKRYPECIPMTKTMYPRYFTFDNTKGTRWNEEKVNEENKKISAEYSRNPSEKFKTGSVFYNELMDYVSLFGFNVEQAEVIVGSKMVGDMLDFTSKLNFVHRLAITFRNMLNESEPVSGNYLTYDVLKKNDDDGKYFYSLTMKKYKDENYIFNANESAEWNREQVAKENLAIKESNQRNRAKLKESSVRLESDIKSYLMGLHLTEEQAECLWSESSSLRWVFADYGLNVPSYVDFGLFSELDFYVALLNELRSKSVKLTIDNK